MDYFYFDNPVEIRIGEDILNETVKELIVGFLYRIPDVRFSPAKDCFVSVGNAEKTDVPTVSRRGIYIPANNPKELIDRLFFVFGKAEACFDAGGNAAVRIPIGEYAPSGYPGVKMIHLCAFPETEFFVLKRAIRLAGVLGYTHVILEFWGTFPFKCLNELSWKNERLSEARVAELIREIRALQMEPVPMMNCFGHASGCRVLSGKHVMLDQDLRLVPYFINSGWTWNFRAKQTRELLKKMRGELTEVFGDGAFFHIGFDESYYEPENEKDQEDIYSYLGDICEEVRSEGRRPIVWGDLLLYKNAPDFGTIPPEKYYCGAVTQEVAEKMLYSLPKYALIADWQYDAMKTPWKTARYLKSKGYDVIACPWYEDENIASAAETVKEEGLFGTMVTTWHYLGNGNLGTPSVVFAGKLLNENDRLQGFGKTLGAAELLRKVYFAGSDYENGGWVSYQVKDKLD